MKTYKITGEKKGKKYISRRSFKTEDAATKASYKMIYNPSGNTKRKNQLYNVQIV